MKTPFYFTIELPGTGQAMTWIGGGLKPSAKPGFVWLTRPNGEPVLEAPLAQVHPTTPEAIAAQLKAERDGTCQCDLCRERRLKSN